MSIDSVGSPSPSSFTKLWGPNTTDAEKLGFAFMYDEDGSLISETGTGGANSAGSTQYIYLPTGNGPMPIAAVIDGQLYAVHSDHLNTPRRLTDRQGQAVWQWAYSAFGDEEPTTAKNRFANLSITPNPGTTGISDMAYNIGFMGMYRDQESGLAQNWNRYFDKRLGRYTQPDRIGLGGGPNRYPYANLNPLMFMDPTGLMGQGSGVYGVPSGQPVEEPTFSITKRGICDGADTMCAPAMEAAGLKGPYFSETKKYSASCLATIGIVVKGGGAVLGNAAAKQVPRAAEALGAGARTMGLIGRGVALFTNPAATGGSLGFAIPALLEHCEIKEPPICLAGSR